MAISWDTIKMGFITFVYISLAKILSYVHTYLQGNLGNDTTEGHPRLTVDWLLSRRTSQPQLYTLQ